MAYSAEQWERARALFESGQYSLSQIQEKTGIDKSQISRKSKIQQWQQGRNADYIEARVVLAEKKSTENTTTLQVLDDIADEQIRHKRLINGNAEKLAGKIATMADQTDRPKDIKELAEANMILGKSLGVIEQFAKSGDVNVNATAGAVATAATKTLSDFYDET